MTGWLASRLGWRNVMFFCLCGSDLPSSSLLCGMADSLEALILDRVGQGLFGAPLMPMGQGIVLATFPRHLHTAGHGDLGRRQRHGAGVRADPRQHDGRGLRLARRLLYDRAARFVALAASGLRRRTIPGRTQTHLDWSGFPSLSAAIAAPQLIFPVASGSTGSNPARSRLETATHLVVLHFRAH